MRPALFRPAIVLGGASSLGDDLLQATDLLDPADCMIVAVNDAGFGWPGYLDAWCTMHPVELPWRERFRAERGFPAGYVRVTHPHDFGMRDRERLCDETLGGPWKLGGSGLLAVGWALEGLGASHVLLCGVPMDERPHFNRARPWHPASSYRRGWLGCEARMQGRARSFSGWTRDLLGAPGHDWLDSSVASRVQYG